MSPETKSQASAEGIARAYFERVTARDPDGMMEFWTPGGIGNIHGVAVLRAPEEYRTWFANLFASFPDSRFEVLEVVADDDQAVVRWRMAGTFDGDVPFQGMLPTGASISFEGIDLLKIADGKITALEAYMNGDELARQVGALPPQGSGADRALLGALNLRTRAARALRRS